MKQTLLIFATVIFSISITKGQDTVNPLTEFLLKRGYTFPGTPNPVPDSLRQWPDTLYYNTTYKSKLMGSVTIPFYFSLVNLHTHGITDASFTLTSTVNIGIGYTWFWGDFIFGEDDKVTVNPSVYFGLMANTGLENGLNFKQGGLLTGGFIGVSSFTLFFAYDIINKAPSLGAGGRIDFYSISQKFLHIMGKVHSVRKHKKVAAPIAYE